MPGESTALELELATLLQKLANETSTTIVQLSGAVNPKLKMWLRAQGNAMGFVITEDELDGRTLKARRVFIPQGN